MKSLVIFIIGLTLIILAGYGMLYHEPERIVTQVPLYEWCSVWQRPVWSGHFTNNVRYVYSVGRYIFLMVLGLFIWVILLMVKLANHSDERDNDGIQSETNRTY